MQPESQQVFQDNPELALAHAFVCQTGSSVFLTGKAGTGKTTFLRRLTEQRPKQTLVTAPTGVAAVNAGGVTLHAFFQLPLGPWVPGMERDQSQKRYFRFSKEKQRMVQGLDLLIIDEVSMVRADLLDGVDSVLRRLRQDERPFGGVQLLLIGDLFQLPPVVTHQEKALLEAHYPTCYFFSAKALASIPLVTIELKKIYRQADPAFIDLLNQVRENRLDAQTLSLLDRCTAQGLAREGVITLTTHNRKADQINQAHLDRLPGQGQILAATVEGEFPETAFPTQDRLVLKEGAQVMFLKNDPSPEKRYFNGKIGQVKRIMADKVLVTDPWDGSAPVEVTPAAWENVTYKINAQDQRIEQEVVGRFSQVPLKPAWAVTIHKSQGLTFDRCVVDARDAFAHGQTYVALSRCRTLKGLSLSSPLPREGLVVDPQIVGFMEAATEEINRLEARFQAACLAFQQEMLLRCFDLSFLGRRFYQTLNLADLPSLRIGGLKEIPRLRAEGQEVFSVAEKFLAQLKILMADQTLPDTHPGIRERTAKASAWFKERLGKTFAPLLTLGPVETDNKDLKRRADRAIEDLARAIRTAKAGIGACEKGFGAAAYLGAVSSALLVAPRAPAPAPALTQEDIDHPKLFSSLKAWRTQKARSLGVPAFQVLHQQVLIQIAALVPKDQASLLALRGMGPKTMEQHGEELIGLVLDYLREQGLPDHPGPCSPAPQRKRSAQPEKQAKPPRVDTRQVTLDLFRQGKDIPAIAEERGLTPVTIEGHLAAAIEQGTLSVNDVVPGEKQALISQALDQGLDLKGVKAELGEGVSYGQIRAVMAARGLSKRVDGETPQP